MRHDDIDNNGYVNLSSVQKISLIQPKLNIPFINVLAMASRLKFSSGLTSSVTMFKGMLNFGALSGLTLLIEWQEGHKACKKTEWWDAGMVMCLSQGAPVNPDWFYLPGFIFLALAHPGSPGQSPRGPCMCVFVLNFDRIRVLVFVLT